MAGTTSTWEDELRGWLTPFLDRLGHKARRRMCPLYVMGLIGPGDRKSVQPMLLASRCCAFLEATCLGGLGIARVRRPPWRSFSEFANIGPSPALLS